MLAGTAIAFLATWQHKGAGLNGHQQAACMSCAASISAVAVRRMHAEGLVHAMQMALWQEQRVR